MVILSVLRANQVSQFFHLFYLSICYISVRTKTGELSLMPNELIILTPTLHQLPTLHFGLKDKVNSLLKDYLNKSIY